MLFNNIDTAGVKVNLESGIYYFHLFGLETVDLNDYIRIIGENNFLWRYAEEVDYREPYFGNEYTEYADTVGQGLTVVFKVLEAGEFTIRTDDTFEYPWDDTPSNPVVDLEILQAGDYSAVAEDWIGAVDNNLLSTGDLNYEL
jgi:hypothetical protein